MSLKGQNRWLFLIWERVYFNLIKNKVIEINNNIYIKDDIALFKTTNCSDIINIIIFWKA